MRILVVEDEERLAKAVAVGLQDAGFAVETAGDGRTGFWLAKQEPFDAIVLDLMLPEMSGYEVCKRLRAADEDAVWCGCVAAVAGAAGGRAHAAAVHSLRTARAAEGGKRRAAPEWLCAAVVGSVGGGGAGLWDPPLAWLGSPPSWAVAVQ